MTARTQTKFLVGLLLLINALVLLNIRRADPELPRGLCIYYCCFSLCCALVSVAGAGFRAGFVFNSCLKQPSLLGTILQFGADVVVLLFLHEVTPHHKASNLTDLNTAACPHTGSTRGI